MLKGERRDRLSRWLRSSWVALISGLAALLYAAFFLAGLDGIPFHPDESTYIYMSGDLEIFLQDPLGMAYTQDQPLDTRQRYRLLDAPLTRLAIGLARRLSGLPATPVDWDWTLDWEANAAAGALPGPDLLRAARLATGGLALAALGFLYQAGKRLGLPPVGLLAVGCLALNALYLLHARRAMAEGPMLFGVCLALWGFVEGERRPWLAGLGAALAFNAKHSTLALAPVGLLAVVWLVETHSGGVWRRRALNALQYVAVFGLLTLALNPWLWRQPVAALQAAQAERTLLLANQVRDISTFAPGQVLDGAGERSLAVLYNLYLRPLSFAELGSYSGATEAAEAAYLENPLHTFLRGRIGGGLLLVLTLVGMVLAVLDLRRVDSRRRRSLALLLLASAAQLAAIIAVIPLAWQRYPLPLLPFMSLWIAYNLRSLDRPGNLLPRSIPL